MRRVASSASNACRSRLDPSASFSSKAPIGNWGSAPMTAGGRNAILEAMAATLPAATCTPALRGAGCYGFAVASGDLHPLQVVRAEHAGTSIKIRDDRTAS
jgi:hypothetical protein